MLNLRPFLAARRATVPKCKTSGQAINAVENAVETETPSLSRWAARVAGPHRELTSVGLNWHIINMLCARRAFRTVSSVGPAARG